MYAWSTREKVILITFRCSELLTQSQTSMTSSCVETFRKDLGRKGHPLLLESCGGGSQYSDWTKLFQLVFQCNPFLMNLLSCTKEREERPSSLLISTFTILSLLSLIPLPDGPYLCLGHAFLLASTTLPWMSGHRGRSAYISSCLAMLMEPWGCWAQH